MASGLIAGNGRAIRLSGSGVSPNRIILRRLRLRAGRLVHDDIQVDPFSSGAMGVEDLRTKDVRFITKLIIFNELQRPPSSAVA